jgi:aminoglycoside 2'-N-acetyltransferase I
MDDTRIRAVPHADLSPAEITEIRALLWSAFGAGHEDGPMAEDDWEHAVGGTWFLAVAGGAIVACAAVVEREIRVAGRPLRTGYVEAVATAPVLQGRGLGTLVMAAAGAHIRTNFEFGTLATGALHFYERLGWRAWAGPSAVRMPDGSEKPSPDEDGYLLVLETPATPAGLPPDAQITCGWRPGASW